jgi:hypothetical protein
MAFLGRASMTRDRQIMAAIAVVLAAGVAVLVNVWTTAWGWPAGAGLAALVLCQAGLEGWRRGHEHAPGSSNSRRMVVRQRARDVVDSDLTGIKAPPVQAEVQARQRLGRVRNSTVIGIDGNPARDSDGRP